MPLIILSQLTVGLNAISKSCCLFYLFCFFFFWKIFFILKTKQQCNCKHFCKLQQYVTFPSDYRWVKKKAIFFCHFRDRIITQVLYLWMRPKCYLLFAVHLCGCQCEGDKHGGYDSQREKQWCNRGLQYNKVFPSGSCRTQSQQKSIWFVRGDKRKTAERTRSKVNC